MVRNHKDCDNDHSRMGRSVRSKDHRPLVIHFPGAASFSRSGITFPPSLSQGTWEGIGARLAQVSNSSAWWLADWLIYGETSFSGRYRDALARTGLDYQTLRNYAWVARRFDQSRRREGLSFAHHAEVARLSPPEQDYWLRRAEDGEWSRNRLREEVRASLTQRQEASAEVSVAQAERERASTVPPDAPTVIPAAPDSRQTNDPVAIEVELPAEQLDRCVQAAVSCGLTVNDWAARVLQLATDAPTWQRLRVASAASDVPQGNDDAVPAEAERVAQYRQLDTTR